MTRPDTSPTRTQAAPADDASPLDAFLCFAVYSTGLAFNRTYKPLLDRFGLTYAQYLLLVALYAREGQTVSELGDQLFLESNTLTPLIKRVEAAGLVSRRRDTQDERVVRVSLTDEGRRVMAEASECVPAGVASAAGLSIEEMTRLKDQLVKLRAQLSGS